MCWDHAHGTTLAHSLTTIALLTESTIEVATRTMAMAAPAAVQLQTSATSGGTQVHSGYGGNKPRS